MALVAVMTMAAATISVVPATAAPEKPKGEPIASVTVKASSIKGNTRTEDLTCLAYWSPEPQYSASNHTIHYGIWVWCNYVATLSLKVQIFVKSPLTGNVYEPAGNPITTNPVGETGAAGGVAGCFAGPSATWQARFWGNANLTGNFLPYPAFSPSHTYPCD